MTYPDKQMALIRTKGFKHLISSYGFITTQPYRLDAPPPTDEQAKQFGFENAQALINATWKAIDDHAVEANWVPVAWNICDEPVADKAPGFAQQARMHKEAARNLKLTTFMGATSMTGDNPKNPHYELVQALPIPSLNIHDEGSLSVVKAAGNRPSIYNGGNRWTFGRYMKFLVVKHELALRLTWHLNVTAGDPYYGLDCREEDFCWFNTNVQGDMIPSMQILGHIQPGLNDYRYLSTLQRLIKEKPGHPAAGRAKKLFDEMMDLQAGTDRSKPGDFDADRTKVAEAIESMLK
jgi:hypothetical protein